MEREGAAAAAGAVLLTLCAGQFLMMLDSSVMNVSIATVAKDVGTTVTGIQTAITLYTLVMASLMITGGKIGQIIGRKRAFAIGCVIYGCGSFITAISPSLGVLLLGWSCLEGIGAALILPAIVALVASNFGTRRAPARLRAGRLCGRDRDSGRPDRRRPVHDLPLLALCVRGRGADRDRDPLPCPPHGRGRAPRRKCGSIWSAPALSALGLGLIVFGILRSGTWGFVKPKPGAPEWLGLSPTIWLILGGGIVLWLFLAWENRLLARGGEPLIDPDDPAQPAAARRPDRVLLPVLSAGRPVLRGAAVPLGRAGALGDRNRCAAAAALADADHRGRGHPASSSRSASPRRVVRLGFVIAVRRPRGDGRRRSTRGPVRR